MAVRYFWKIRKMLRIDICFDPVNRLDEYHDTLIDRPTPVMRRLYNA